MKISTEAKPNCIRGGKKELIWDALILANASKNRTKCPGRKTSGGKRRTEGENPNQPVNSAIPQGKS